MELGRHRSEGGGQAGRDKRLAEPRCCPPVGLRSAPALAKVCITWDGESCPRDVSSELDREALQQLVDGRLSSVALSLLRTQTGITAPRGILELLKEVSRVQAAEALAVEATSAEALRRLVAGGIRVMVIKGPAVAQYLHQPGHRTYSDIDLLVPPRDFRSAQRILSSMGYVRAEESEQPWRWFEKCCIEGVNLRREEGWKSIDLHHHIAPWVFAKELKAERLFARSRSGTVAGIAVRIPCPEDALVIASLHVVNDLWKTDPSYNTWRDVYMLASDLPRERASAAFRRRGLGWLWPYVESSLAFMTDKPRQAWARNSSPSGRLNEWRLGALGWHGDTFAVRHPLGWVIRLPLARAAAFALGSLIPSPSYAQGKHDGYLAYWNDIASSLRQALSGQNVTQMRRRS